MLFVQTRVHSCLRTDERMDGGDYNIPFAFFKKGRGDNDIK